MRQFRKLSCVICLIMIVNLLSGCYGYREINDLPLVLGVAIDKTKEGNYILTIELEKPLLLSQVEYSAIATEIKQTEGETIYDAARDMILRTGQKLYWAQMAVCIVSQDIAKEGMAPVLDLFNRDIEIRDEIYLLVSRDSTAAEILKEGKKSVKESVSFYIKDAMEYSYKNLKYNTIMLWQFIDDLSLQGKAAILPTISKDSLTEKSALAIYGDAVFKGDKLVRILNGNESKTLRLIQDGKINGILTIKMRSDKNPIKVSLNVIKTDANIKPIYENNKLEMNINLGVYAIISEIMSSQGEVLSEEGREKLKKQTENQIKFDIENLMGILKNDVQCDVLGFGEMVKNRYPKYWKSISKNWPDHFSMSSYNVNVNVHFKGTSSRSTQIKIGGTGEK